MSLEVSVAIITRNRPDELHLTVANVLDQGYPDLEILVFENGSDPAVEARNRRHFEAMPEVKYLSTDQNLGVSGGRTKALKEVGGRYIIEIDDDAVFAGPGMIERVITVFEDKPDAGILAFRITNYHTGVITPYEFPFRNKERDPDRPGPCAWFIGAGHAFRHEVLRDVGYYRDFFPWGSEEQDLAIRALDNGYEIYYEPELHVLHKKSPKARIDDIKEFSIVALKNRLKVALLNLPWYSVITYALIRGTQWAIRTRDLTVPFRALSRLMSERDYIGRHRQLIKRDTVRLLRERQGQLYF